MTPLTLPAQAACPNGTCAYARAMAPDNSGRHLIMPLANNNGHGAMKTLLVPLGTPWRNSFSRGLLRHVLATGITNASTKVAALRNSFNLLSVHIPTNGCHNALALSAASASGTPPGRQSYRHLLPRKCLTYQTA